MMTIIFGIASLVIALIGMLVKIRIDKKKAGLPVFHLKKNAEGSHWYIVAIFAIACLIRCGSNNLSPTPEPGPEPTPPPTLEHERGFIKQPGVGLHPGAPFMLAERIPELPIRFSWALQYDLPVENQSHCGSCWAFSTVENFEWAAALFLDKKVTLSKQFMVSQMFMGCGGGDFGGSLEVEDGLPLESDCPYQANNRRCKSGVPIALKASQAINIGDGQHSPSVAQIKEAILQYGPQSCDVSADGEWDGLGHGDIISGNGGGINHMIEVYGFDDSLGDHGVWLMRNSWGEKWADKGSALVAYGADSICTDVATVLVKPVGSYKQWQPVNPIK